MTRKESVNRIGHWCRRMSSSVSSREITRAMLASPKPSVSTVETTNRWGGEGKIEHRSRPKLLTSVTLRVVASVITCSHRTNPTTFGNFCMLASCTLHSTPWDDLVEWDLSERLI